MKPIKVLIVDDSALVRRILLRGLSDDPQISIVGTAGDANRAQKLIEQTHPDVLTLDIEMPGTNGLIFLKHIMKNNPLPVIMVSALTQRGSRITLEALASGAVDFILKPMTNVKYNLSLMLGELKSKIKMAAKANIMVFKNQTGVNRKPLAGQKISAAYLSSRIIAIGASTGGTRALRFLLGALPPDMPGMVVVQHMPAGFTFQFAQQLNAETAFNVKEAQSGDEVRPGHVLIAPGNFHLQLVRHNKSYRVICRAGARINGYRPSVDVLFRSVAKHAGEHAIGIMLTGMGDDGADAMVKMREKGAFTLAQDKDTSVVFGMPKEAYFRGGAMHLLPLSKIPEYVVKHLNQNMAWVH